MTAWPSLATCCLLSQIAYLADGDALIKLAMMGFGQAKAFHDDRTDTHGFTCRSDCFDVVGFKGTKSLTDFLEDARIIQSLWLGCWVHSGFLDGYQAVGPDIWVGTNYRPVLVVGHSLGGARATLCSYHLHRMPQTGPIRCVTFGSPRVGDLSFVTSYNRMGIETTRVVHHDDIVPRVPHFNYHHVDGLLHLMDDGTRSNELRNWWRNLWGWNHMIKEEAQQALADIDGQAVADHSLDSYAAVLTKYLTKELAHAA